MKQFTHCSTLPFQIRGRLELALGEPAIWTEPRGISCYFVFHLQILTFNSERYGSCAFKCPDIATFTGSSRFKEQKSKNRIQKAPCHARCACFWKPSWLPNYMKFIKASPGCICYVSSDPGHLHGRLSQYVTFLTEVYGYSHSCCRHQLRWKVFTVRLLQKTEEKKHVWIWALLESYCGPVSGGNVCLLSASMLLYLFLSKNVFSLSFSPWSVLFWCAPRQPSFLSISRLFLIFIKVRLITCKP